MDILLTGKLSSISVPFIEKLSDNNKVTMASQDIDKEAVGGKARTIDISEKQELFDNVFLSYSFDTVIFFSSSFDNRVVARNELTVLDRILQLCKGHLVERFIYILPSSVYARREVKHEASNYTEYADSSGIILATCAELCDYYRRTENMSILSMCVPCTYGFCERTSEIADILNQIRTQSSVRFNAAPEQIYEYLYQADLAELIVRILCEWPENEYLMDIPGSTVIKVSDFASKLIDIWPTLRVSYAGYNPVIPPAISSTTTRNLYDWVPCTELDSDMVYSLYAAIKRNMKADKVSLKDKLYKFISKHPIFIKVTEIIIGFALMEMFNSITNTMTQFQYVDFRLLYVLLISVIHGLKSGFASALLASLSCIVAYSELGTSWQVLLYNIDNWFPFACYFITAAAAGYTSDKKLNEIKALKASSEALERKVLFLNEIYSDALKNKSEFKTQILSYRDSFGRIYDIAYRLNSVLPGEIFDNALSAMEDILQNNTISIYTVNAYGDYARLTVCSSKINQTTPKTIKLSNYEIMMRELKSDEIWSNSTQMIDYPEYCAPIYKDNKIVVLILIYKVRFGQMALYYKNLIKVLCGLIQVSLLRALEYNEHLYQTLYIENTHILKPDRFRMMLESEQRREQKEISEYTLLHVIQLPEKRMETGEFISTKLRNTDIVGLSENGDLYVILTQTGRMNNSIVLKRLADAGILFEQVDTLPETDEPN